MLAQRIRLTTVRFWTNGLRDLAINIAHKLFIILSFGWFLLFSVWVARFYNDFQVEHSSIPVPIIECFSIIIGVTLAVLFFAGFVFLVSFVFLAIDERLAESGRDRLFRVIYDNNRKF